MALHSAMTICNFCQNCCFCHCTQQFFAIFIKTVVFVIFVGFLKLDPLVSSGIACNNFLVIFLEIVIFVNFVDYLQLFVIFVIACNSGQKSLYTPQVTLSIFSNILSSGDKFPIKSQRSKPWLYERKLP